MKKTIPNFKLGTSKKTKNKMFKKEFFKALGLQKGFKGFEPFDAGQIRESINILLSSLNVIPIFRAMF